MPIRFSLRSGSHLLCGLPIDAVIPDVLQAIVDHRALVLVAPPGAGKTTRVPPAVLEAGLLRGAASRLVLLQPRRIAARASAARIAAERGWTLGHQVGYQVRFDRRITRETRLIVQTEGILNRQILDDPFLEGVGAVVLDEFHERSLHTDLAIALLREIRASVRDDLILIVMSATLDAEPVARFLGGCPILHAEGRSHPVTIEHEEATDRTLAPRVTRAIQRVLADPATGDILVFLPGAEEIRRVARLLDESDATRAALVLPLHGSLTAEEQDRALRPAGRRKVVLATNVAETSLTIEGIGTVIDSGLARFPQHDAVRGLDRLELARISKASATQRAGRAGRLGPGRCVKLWSPREERGMPATDRPEIARVDLCGTLLTVLAWGGDPRRFEWFERPPEEAITAGLALLELLGAVAEGRLTAIGRHLLALPVHPRLGRMLLSASAWGCLPEAASLAALLEEKEILARGDFLGPRPASTAATSRGRSDLLERLDLFHQWRREGSASRAGTLGLDLAVIRRVDRARGELLRLAERWKLPRGPALEPSEDDLLRLALLAYPDRVTRRREPGSESGVMVGGRGMRLDRASVVRDAEFFLALDPRDERRGATLEARVRLASEIRREWLEEFLPDGLRHEHRVEFDEGRGRAVAVDRDYYRDLLIREVSHGTVSRDEAERVLIAALARQARTFVREQPAAAAWLDRLECLRQWVPEGGWPTLDDDALAEVVASACAGRATVDEARAVPLVPILQGRFSYTQARAFEEQAPEALLVPSGSRIRLVYEPGRPPVLAVRLQELFGWAETPRVALGRVPVLLHLLGPNYRPVQITDDLNSFWNAAYFQVRKDLRARYPKHFWPEDPVSARPEARGGRRRD